MAVPPRAARRARIFCVEWPLTGDPSFFVGCLVKALGWGGQGGGGGQPQSNLGVNFVCAVTFERKPEFFLWAVWCGLWGAGGGGQSPIQSEKNNKSGPPPGCVLRSMSGRRSAFRAGEEGRGAQPSAFFFNLKAWFINGHTTKIHSVRSTGACMPSAGK